MFTGIIQEVGRVHEVKPVGGGLQLTVRAAKTCEQLGVNDSVSVNGVCQTVVHKMGERFTVVAVEETLSKTTFGALKPCAHVNIELALQIGERLGGHLVSGHVDCVGQIEAIQKRETSWIFHFSIPTEFERYVIPMGSIAIDGVSLTVASVEEKVVAVSIIPHTMENTILSTYAPKNLVNLEFDMIGKYIERLLGARGFSGSESISPQQLREWGYDI